MSLPRFSEKLTLAKLITSVFALVFFLSACSAVTERHPAVLTDFGEKVELNIPAGKYQRYTVNHINGGKPIDFKATISEPRSTTEWGPSMSYCAHGENKSERNCIWFAVSADDKTGYATPYNGMDEALARKLILPARFAVGKPLAMRIQLGKRNFSIMSNGVLVYQKDTDFDVVGYSFFCSSAKCEFLFSE